MKRLLILAGVLSLLVFATACKKEEPVAPVEESPAVEATATDMEQAAQEAMDDATAAVEETADQAMEAGKEMVEEGQAMVEETGEAAMEKGQEMLDQAAEGAESMMDDADKAMDMEMPEKP